jgi:hypothetical protein
MATGSGPIQYDELFNSDVNSKLAELSGIVTKLQSDFQGLGSTIESMSGTINVNIKANNTALKEMSDSLKTVDVTTRGAGATMTDYAKEVENSTKKSKDLKDQQELLNKTFDLATASVDEIKARTKQLTAEYNALGSATDANKAKAAALSSEVIGLKNQQDLLSSALVKSKNGLVQTEGSYNQMNLTLTKLRADLKEIPNAIDKQTGAWNKNNPAVKEHLEKINQLDSALKKVDGSMGVHTRDVGDYSEKIREAVQDMLPFGSELGRMGQAFHDLSPVISSAVESMGALAVGAIGVGSAIAAIVAVPIYSFLTGTQEGENLLLLQTNKLEIAWNGAKEAVENFGDALFHSGDAFDRWLIGNDAKLQKQADNFRKRAAELKAAGKEDSYDPITGEVTVENISRTNKLAQQITDLQIKIKKNEGDLALETGRANRSFQEQRDILNDTLLTGEDGEKKRKQAGEKALEVSKKLEDLRAEELKDQLKLLTLQVSENLHDEDLIENQNKIKVLRAAIEQNAADGIKERFRVTRTLRTLELDDIKAAEKAKKDADDAEKKRQKEAEAARLKAIKDADTLLQIQTKTNIAELESKEIKDLAGAGSESEKRDIVIKFEQDKLNVIIAGIDAREKLYKKDSIEFKTLESEKVVATTASQKAIEKETEDSLKRQQALDVKYAKLREDLLTTQGKGNTAYAEFRATSKTYKGSESEQEEQKQAALYQIRSNALKNELALVDVKNASIKDATERQLTSENDKAKITNELNELAYKNFEDLHNKEKKKLDEIFGYLKQNAGIISEFYGQEMGNLFDSLTTNLENMVKGTGNTIENWANTLKAGVGAADALFKEGSDARIASLEAEKQQQIEIAGSNATAKLAIEKQFNEKIRAEKIKQAKIDKAAAIFDIIINTAVAATKVGAQTGIFGLALAPIIIAFGAIQAALVAARPLPAFRAGTQNAPQGFAEVAEDGPELIESRRGMRIAHKRQVTYLERGDKVFTAEQTRKILDTNQIDNNTELHGRLSTNLHRQSSEQRIREMSIAFRQDPDAIGEAVGREIKGLPIHQTYFDERGVSRYIRENGTTTKYLNDRTTLR